MNSITMILHLGPICGSVIKNLFQLLASLFLIEFKKNVSYSEQAKLLIINYVRISKVLQNWLQGSDFLEAFRKLQFLIFPFSSERLLMISSAHYESFSWQLMDFRNRISKPYACTLVMKAVLIAHHNNRNFLKVKSKALTSWQQLQFNHRTVQCLLTLIVRLIV